MSIKINEATSKKLDELAGIMNESDVNYLCYESGDTKIKLKRNILSPVTDDVSITDNQISVEDKETEEEELNVSLKKIKSDRVGYFYLISPKTKKYYITENQKISEGDIIGLIVSMKAEYPVKSPLTGIVKNILIDNAQPVEYGQPLYEIIEN